MSDTFEGGAADLKSDVVAGLSRLRSLVMPYRVLT